MMPNRWYAWSGQPSTRIHIIDAGLSGLPERMPTCCGLAAPSAPVPRWARFEHRDFSDGADHLTLCVECVQYATQEMEVCP